MRNTMRGISCIAFSIFFITGCSTDKGTGVADDPGYISASGVNGGRLYDNFWAQETGYNKSDIALYDQYPDFFRCEHCHGWDLLGREGHSANCAPAKTMPNIANRNLFASTSKSTSVLFQAIKNGDDPAKRRSPTVDLSTYDPVSNSAVGDEMPKFSEILSDPQIWDLVKFVKTEIFDVKQLYDCAVSGTYPAATVTISNIGKDGNAVNGLAIYNQNCGSCHGPSGGDMFVDGGIMTVGAHLRLKPYRDAHTFRFGVLGGSGMEAEQFTLQQLKDLFKALTDPTQFP